MANIVIPQKSVELIEQLELRFPDKLDVAEDVTSPFERGKNAGKIELIRELRFYLEQATKIKLKGTSL